MLALREPQGGGPFIISTETLNDLVSGYRSTSKTFRWLAMSFGVLGTALLAHQLARGSISKFRRWRLRCAVSSCHGRATLQQRAEVLTIQAAVQEADTGS